MSLIKICGLKSKEDISYANELKPDFIGFIFAKGSKRLISLEIARELERELSKNIISVGVFKDNSLEEVLEAASFLKIIQLHGRESEDFIKEVRKAFKGKIIKAFPIDQSVVKLSSSADYFLLDNKNAGSGTAFDWDLLDRFKDILSSKCFLAGGISILNIHKALSFNPYAIDVSSGAELDGVKNYSKMKELIDITRNN